MDLAHKQSEVASIVAEHETIAAQKKTLSDRVRPIVQEFGLGPHRGPNNVLVKFRKSGDEFVITITDPSKIT